MFMVFHLTPNQADHYVSVSDPAMAAKYWNRAPDLARFAHYAAVAIVNCDTVDQVFTLTNAISRTWTKNEEVTHLRATPERSTSVWDVIMDMDNGRLHICAPFGWEDITALTAA